MHIHYVTMQFPAPSETFASQDVRLLRERGVDIEVHAFRPRHAHAAEMLDERGLSTLRTHHNGLVPTLRGAAAMAARPLLALRALWWIGRRTVTAPNYLLRSLVLLPRAFDILATVERSRADVVHVFWGHYPAIAAWLVQRRLPEVATFISLNAYDLEMEHPISADVARAAEIVRTHASVNVAHVARFTGVDPGRIHVIFNGVDLERLDAIASRTRRVPRLLVTAGRLTAAKGMFEAVETLARVRQRWPEAHLKVLGDGPEMGPLRRRAHDLGVADAVSFEGHVSHDRVVEALAQAEVCLLLTMGSDERLPNVVKEGMACRSVVITTPTPGIEELLVDRQHGFLVPPGDPDAAASAIDQVFAGHVDGPAMTESARRRIEDRFDLARTVPRYLELWRQAIAERRGPAREAPERGESTTGRHV